MGRKLPWAISKDHGEAQISASTPNRTKSTQPVTRTPKYNSSTLAASTEVPETSKKRSTRRIGSRSPSTSPPPGPPDVEYMQEGLDADDGYMMVEDEFQTVAQSFTAHLHHAEYKRLMKNAKNARRADIPQLSSQMSNEVKSKLQQAVLSRKQKAGLDREFSKSSQIEDDTVAAEEEEISNPWTGTSLAGLMTTSSQPKTSLKGLERISSSTQAARGYTPSMDQSSYGKVERGGAENPADRSFTQSTTSVFKSQSSLTRNSTTNVEAETKKRPRDTLDTRRSSTNNWTANSESEPRKSPRATKPFRSGIDSLDDFDDETFDRINNITEPPVKTERVPTSKAQKSKDRKSRLDEVPVFLA